MVDDLLGKPPTSPRPSRIQLIKAGGWLLGGLILLVWIGTCIESASNMVYRLATHLPDRVQYERAVAKNLGPLASGLDASAPVAAPALTDPVQPDTPAANPGPPAAAAIPAAAPGAANRLVEAQAKLVAGVRESIQYQISDIAFPASRWLGRAIFAQLVFTTLGCALMLLATWRLRQGLLARFEERADREESILRFVQASRLAAVFMVVTMVIGGIVTGALKAAAFPQWGYRGSDGGLFVGLTVAALLWFVLPYLLVRPARPRGKGKRELEQEVEALRAKAEALAQENSQFV